MHSLTDCYELSNGLRIPCVGFGTWEVTDGEVCVKAVSAALKLGYRHIDGAAAYRNEESVGRGIRESGVERKDIFLTSKLHNDSHGYDLTMRAFEKTLTDLGTDYLDLYLIHWPNPLRTRDCRQQANAGTWKAFEELYRAGKIRAIGLSNFHERHWAELVKTAEIRPMVNQIRLCPGDRQPDVVSFSRREGMLLEAYSPLGRGGIMNVPELKALSDKYGKSVPQIALRWSLDSGFLPLPKSVHPDRIAANADIFDFELDPEDKKVIDALEGCCGYSQDPDTTPF